MTTQNTNTAKKTQTTEERLEKKQSEERALRSQLKDAKARATRLEKLRAYKAGTVCEANPKGHTNTSLLPDTLRKAKDDERIGKSYSHGWVVEIVCPTCKKHVLINTQDAFQKTHCNEHAKKARRIKAKASRDVKALPEKVKDTEARLKSMRAELKSLQG